VIVATAGHVDHGKTSLVQALTGIDTDRLDEEKRRGMTIEVGFAYADFGGPQLTGFVDVPGHDRFVRNMLAGVSAIDLALLVVAADDGPMPQTREHLAILAMLGAARLTVVLTKIDRAAPEQQAQSLAAIRAMLAPTPYASAPVFAVDTPRQIGIAMLRDHLRQAQADHVDAVPQGNFRLAIDRSFSVTGAGLVVTGVVLSGTACVGDQLVISPLGTGVRVRGIHAQNRPAPQARTGERCAINLAGTGLQRDAVGRGQWLLAQPAHAPTSRLDVWLAVLADAPRALPHYAPVQVHIGAAAVSARVALLTEPGLAPGASGLAQLVLEHPVAALRGDRFVLRDPAAQRTMGGGYVIDPFAPARGRAKPARLAALAVLDKASASAALPPLLAQAPWGIDLARVEQASNLTPADAAALREQLAIRQIASPDGLIGLSGDWWMAWLAALPRVLAQLHAAHPDRVGPSEPVLARTAAASLLTASPASAHLPGGPPHLTPATEPATASPLVGTLSGAPVGALSPTSLRQAERVGAAAIRALAAQALIIRDGVCLRLPGHQAALLPADQALLDQIVRILQAAGTRPPIVGELATQLSLERAETLTFTRKMASLGHLLAIAPNRFFLPETLVQLTAIARRLADASPDGSFDAAQYRDASGIGRNLTIEVLEFLDRAGVTRFGSERRRLSD
jgi:selenocysteine-specific elongation factor